MSYDECEMREALTDALYEQDRIAPLATAGGAVRCPARGAAGTGDTQAFRRTPALHSVPISVVSRSEVIGIADECLRRGPRDPGWTPRRGQGFESPQLG